MKPESLYQKAITGIGIIAGLAFLYFVILKEDIKGILFGLLLIAMIFISYKWGESDHKERLKSRKRWNKYLKN